MSFNHFDDQGQAIMVDVSAKQPTLRTARARAVVRLTPAILQAILDGRMTKGDVLGVARLAGIAAAKKTPDLPTNGWGGLRRWGCCRNSADGASGQR